MNTQSNPTQQTNQKRNVIYQRTTSEAVYGLGLIGAWVYYISHATTIWLGILGIFKGIFWPAMLVYELLKFLEM